MRSTQHAASRALRYLGIACALSAAAVARADKVLILDQTVTSGASSREALAAQALGFTVDVVDATTWAAMSAADFGQYRAIILGDPTCGSLGSIAAAAANASVWGGVVNGNAVVLGTDPVFHATYSGSTGAATLIRDGIAFATSKPGMTGAYVSLSCYYVDDPPTPVAALSYFGSFVATGVPGCFNDAHIVASGDAIAGLSDADLSNWSCSVHEALTSYPPDFVPLAIARGAPGGVSFADGSSGVPYIVARGAVPVKCGDGVVQPPEECDDGASNGVPGDKCSSICKLHWCGDGVVDPGEACDLGAANGNPGSTCSATCTAVVLPNKPPVAKCQDVTTATPANACSAGGSVDAGSYDPDPGDSVTCTQSPAAPYALGITPVTLTCQDTHGASSSCNANVNVVDTTPPAPVCPASQVLECTDHGAAATFTPTVSDNCGKASIGCATPSGSTFSLGTSSDLCTATDGSGNTAACSFSITVQDTTPPVVTTSGAVPVLWPADHGYREFSLASCVTSIVDACDGPLDLAHAVITHVTSDEPEVTPGSGNTCDDAVITGSSTASLRAERDGSGDGRVYTIFFDVHDDAGNVAHASCKAQVPHDSSGHAAVDSGCAYCVGTGCGACNGHAPTCH